MKKLNRTLSTIILIGILSISMFLLSRCKKERGDLHVITYVIYYTSTPDTINIAVYSSHPARISSSQGTNTIWCDGFIIETTAPVRILDDTVVKSTKQLIQ